MKTLFLLTSAFIISVGLEAQLVSDQTNGIALDFTKEAPDGRVELPEIDWTFPTSAYTNSQENKIEFKAMISSKSPLKSVSLTLGKSRTGEPLGTKTIKIPKNSIQFEFEQSMTLWDGENVIGLIAENVDGGKVIEFRNVLVGIDAISKAVDINRKDYALLIGTDKYDHWSDLVNPVYDVETIGKELEDTYNFETEVLTNPEQDELLIKIKEYATKKYRPQDQLLIFIAGHGQFDETFGEGYLVTRGSLANDAAKTTYVAHSILRNIINNIPCDHILLVMDVCFSGTFDPVIASTRGAYENIDDSELLVRKLSKKTRRYLTSGGKEYVSDGIPGQHSPFAEKFITILKSRGGEDRIITLSEMYPEMQRLKTLPRMGEFGNNEKDSDFVFVVK
ncbi:caspase family protein [Marinoscillum sp.]|uniref:caspase family protein n=1 Tax=Marinoscillum sp. TaxID=2024838 RepID=UPI003BA9CD76